VQEGNAPLPQSTMLSVSNLRVNLDGKAVLEDVTFDLEARKTLAIVGPNGSGKTTLFRALMGLVPYSGRIKWGAESKIGLVPQSLVATDLPIIVGEFLALKRKTGFQDALDSVGLGMDIVRRRLGSLSGGELQRVLIAWAILDRPKVLLFDEPTSGVDIGAEEPIYQRLERLQQELGVTTLLISHNMHVVMHYSDYVLALNKRPLLFSETGKVSHSRLLEIIYGGRVTSQEVAPQESERPSS